MRNARVLVIGSCLVFSILVSGCAAASGEGVLNATSSQAQPGVAATPKLRAAFTRGPMDDPQALKWQSDLLHAIGRDGQYQLFDYVFDDTGPAEKVYVGVSYEALGLNAAQLDAGNAVQAQYATTPVGATAREGMWMGNAWLNAPGGVATAQ
jgi:hypothetical protein